MSIAWRSSPTMRMSTKPSLLAIFSPENILANPCSVPLDTIPLDEMNSPVLHRINLAIRRRAINPSEPLPSPSSKLMQASQPSEEVQARARKHLERLEKVADVKKGLFYLVSGRVMGHLAY